jgi:hypothetical protein
MLVPSGVLITVLSHASTLQLPSLPLPARQGAGPSASTSTSASSSNSSAGFGGADARAAVTIRQTTNVTLLSASDAAALEDEDGDWAAWEKEGTSDAFGVEASRKERHETREQEAKEHSTEALFALGWR